MKGKWSFNWAVYKTLSFGFVLVPKALPAKLALSFLAANGKHGNRYNWWFTMSIKWKQITWPWRNTCFLATDTWGNFRNFVTEVLCNEQVLQRPQKQGCSCDCSQASRTGPGTLQALITDWTNVSVILQHIQSEQLCKEPKHWVQEFGSLVTWPGPSITFRVSRVTDH